MAIDPTALYNPYNPFGPTGGLFSPFGSYFLPPGQGQGLSLAPYSQQTWYGFNPWGQGGTGAGSGVTPLNLWSLYQQLFPAGNSLAGYSFTGAPQATPPITTVAGPARDAIPPFPPIPTIFTPPQPQRAGGTPVLPLVNPIGSSLTAGGGGGSAAQGGVGGTGSAPGPGIGGGDPRNVGGGDPGAPGAAGGFQSQPGPGVAAGTTPY